QTTLSRCDRVRERKDRKVRRDSQMRTCLGGVARRELAAKTNNFSEALRVFAAFAAFAAFAFLNRIARGDGLTAGPPCLARAAGTAAPFLAASRRASRRRTRTPRSPSPAAPCRR